MSQTALPDSCNFHKLAAVCNSFNYIPVYKTKPPSGNKVGSLTDLKCPRPIGKQEVFEISTDECNTNYKFMVPINFKGSVNAYTKGVNLFLLIFLFCIYGQSYFDLFQNTWFLTWICLTAGGYSP
jgi:hypothetical protein